MAAHGIVDKDGRRKRVRTTIPGRAETPIPDLIGRDFSVGEPGQRSCGDITSIPTDEGWLYPAGVFDLGRRRVIGDARDEDLSTALVAQALKMAIGERDGQVTGMVFHRDRGSQYLSREFRSLCERHLSNIYSKLGVSGRRELREAQLPLR